MSQKEKENRLRLLAKRAGDLFLLAYQGGNASRAKHFHEKRNRILWQVYQPSKG